MNWDQVEALATIRLNLGGRSNCHPARGYEGYVAVDVEPQGEWAVRHDLREPIPLPDGTVDRMHSEDFLEHLDETSIAKLLIEAHRLLRTGGLMRVGVPDYNNPKDRFCVSIGHDPRDHKHLTLTTYPSMLRLVEASPFRQGEFYDYWIGDEFIRKPIDYTKGLIKRTPENDPRTRRHGVGAKVVGRVRDLFFEASRGFRVTALEKSVRRGRRLHITSLVVDLVKR